MLVSGPEIISVGETAARACRGELKGVKLVVVKPVVRDERIAPGASADAAPIAGGYVPVDPLEEGLQSKP